MLGPVATCQTRFEARSLCPLSSSRAKLALIQFQSGTLLLSNKAAQHVGCCSRIQQQRTITTPFFILLSLLDFKDGEKIPLSLHDSGLNAQGSGLQSRPDAVYSASKWEAAPALKPTGSFEMENDLKQQ